MALSLFASEADDVINPIGTPVQELKMRILSRRHFLKNGVAAVGALAAFGVVAEASPILAMAEDATSRSAAEKSRVYFTRELSAEGLRKIYALVIGTLTG